LLNGRWPRFAVSHPCAREKAQGWGTGHLWDCRFGEQDFDPAGWLLVVAEQSAAGIEARGNHAAVVEHQKVARLEQRRELGKRPIPQGPGGAIHRQHAALAALRWRLLGNQLRRQVEVEVCHAKAVHDAPFLK
jgi:hypothetical protein